MWAKEHVAKRRRRLSILVVFAFAVVFVIGTQIAFVFESGTALVRTNGTNTFRLCNVWIISHRVRRAEMKRNIREVQIRDLE